MTTVTTEQTEKCPLLMDEPPAFAHQSPYVMEIIWRNVIVFTFLHAAAFYGLHLVFTSAKMATLLWGKLRYN